MITIRISNLIILNDADATANARFDYLLLFQLYKHLSVSDENAIFYKIVGKRLLVRYR